MRASRRGLVVGVLSALALLAPGARLAAQAAGTVPLQDPAYAELARLEAFGLIAHGSVAQRPYSRARVGWMAGEARRALKARTDLPGPVRADLTAILDRLDARFGPAMAKRSELLVEGEAGGGKSPGHTIPDNSRGGVDAVVNPLWAYRDGRAYGDEGTLAADARGTVALGSRVAVGLAGRAAALRYSGARTGRRGATVEAAYVRALLGRVAIEVGRDAWTFGHGGDTGLLASSDQPPLNMVRISSDRPFHAGFLGDFDFTFLAADLGPHQNFPHAKVFAEKFSVHPATGLELGLTLSNEQMGKGAPAASWVERLKDLSFIWDLPNQDRSYQISDKLASLDGRLDIPSAHGLEIYGEAALTNFNYHRLGQILRYYGAYLAGFRFSRLGSDQRSSLGLEGQLVGPVMYRHRQFTTGTATDGFLRGSALGPDAGGASLQYGYDDAAAGWSTTVTATIERRSADRWAARSGPAKVLYRYLNLPDEHRTRLQVDVNRLLDNGAAGIELYLGVERASNFDYVAGARRTNTAALLRVWRTF